MDVALSLMGKHTPNLLDMVAEEVEIFLAVKAFVLFSTMVLQKAIE